MTTLVMFSGGLDSTAVLARLLSETADDLRVHHIRMHNSEGRADAEKEAVDAIIAWCATHLASDESSFVTAADFKVDGGATAW